ncbi:Crp/Fnr family transcriptional regulator [Pararhizobium mangrovi]|uniref:Cyclic nucleotide-binding domain-containing protein n=1 Tax=Pararhizobium mangrovi TaxID=2590452 RepID=A0A506U780_9HYPH|nr:cyclic nucleotide-binding domain-containing protein [Pararhizobium mangrovi]TPW27747.1 cyclic nucleotide-binding domain-containing protein [Pararhizobium mangrovi]
MALRDDIALLSSVALFGDLGGDALRLIAFGSDYRDLVPGEALFREGEKGEAAYVVASGRLALTHARRGETIELGFAEPGSVLGETALVSTVERKVGATAEDAARVMVIGQRMFRRLLDEYPEAGVLLRDRLQARLASLVADLDRLAPRFSN